MVVWPADVSERIGFQVIFVGTKENYIYIYFKQTYFVVIISYVRHVKGSIVVVNIETFRRKANTIYTLRSRGYFSFFSFFPSLYPRFPSTAIWSPSRHLFRRQTMRPRAH